MAGRGSAPGERRGGRKKGSRNKATAEIKDMARPYCAEALQTLVVLMRTGGEATKKAAAAEIIDRGYGKPAQAVQHQGADGGEFTIKHLLEVVDGSRAVPRR